MPTIRSSDSRIAFRDTGVGLPIVLLHGTAACSSQWSPLIDRLGPWHRIIAPDFHGCGDSDRWIGHRPLDLAEEAMIVAALMARCATPVHLVGHCYGGAVALRVALEYPDWVRSLTVIEPAAFYLLANGGRGDRLLFEEVRTLATDIGHSVSRGDDDKAIGRLAAYWGGTAIPELDSAIQRATQRRAVRQAPHQLDCVFRERTTLNAFRQLHVPTLVLRGQSSPRPMRRIAEMLGTVLPLAHLDTVARAGHGMPVTHAGTVHALIADHFKRNHATRPESNVA